MDWLWLFFEFCIACFEVLMMKMLAEGFLRNRRKLSKLISVSVFIAAVLISFFVSIFLNGEFIAVCLKSILIAGAISFTCCRAKIYWHGIVAALFLLFYDISELLAMYIIAPLNRIEISEIIEIGAYRYQGIAIADIFLFLFIKMICRVRKDDAYDIQTKIWGVLCLLSLFSIFTTLQIGSISTSETVTVLSVLSLLGLLFSNILFFSITEGVIRRSEDKERLAAIEAQLAAQKEHNLKLAESHSQYRRLSHDFKHHAQAFHVLYETGQYDELFERVKELAEYQQHIQPIPDTGNPMIDAVLSAKRGSAGQSGIQWDVSVNIPSELPVPAIELCAILGNALDNAIEACLRIEGDRFISLDLHTEGKILLCEIRNTLGWPPQTQGENLKTLKADTRCHGVGLKSMRECCERLGGQMSYDFDDAAFEVRILLPFNF